MLLCGLKKGARSLWMVVKKKNLQALLWKSQDAEQYIQCTYYLVWGKMVGRSIFLCCWYTCREILEHPPRYEQGRLAELQGWGGNGWMDGWRTGLGKFSTMYMFLFKCINFLPINKLKIAWKLVALHPAHRWSWSWDGFPNRWSPRRWLSVWSTITRGKKSWGWGGNTGHGSQKSSTTVWWVKAPGCCFCGPHPDPTPRFISG